MQSIPSKNTILNLKFQVKVLWDSAGVKWYSSAWGEEGKGKTSVDCALLNSYWRKFYWLLTSLLLLLLAKVVLIVDFDIFIVIGCFIA